MPSPYPAYFAARKHEPVPCPECSGDMVKETYPTGPGLTEPKDADVGRTLGQAYCQNGESEDHPAEVVVWWGYVLP